MHTGSWFKVVSSSGFLRVDKGGRQGCKFGGVIFNLAYAKALRRFVTAAMAENIPVRFNFAPGAAPSADFTNAVDSNNGDPTSAMVLDVTFVDDEAIVVTSAVPASLTKKLSRIVCLLAGAFDWYGMTIN